MAGDEDGESDDGGSGDTLVNADRATGCAACIGRGLRLLRSSGAIRNATSKLRFCGRWCSATTVAGNEVCTGCAMPAATGGEYRDGGDEDAAVVTFLC